MPRHGTSLNASRAFAGLQHRFTWRRGFGSGYVAGIGALLIDRYSSTEVAVYFYRAVRAASPSYVKPSDDTGIYPNVWDSQFRQKLKLLGTRLIDILRHSARFDVASREVVEGYKEAFNASRFLEERLETHGDWNRSVIEALLLVLSRNTDTVIALKHGHSKALEASRRAAELLEEFLNDSPKAF